MQKVVIANPRPFRIVKTDINDTWKPDLDDINSNAYDYLKLHRLSTSIFLDKNKKNLALVSFDGSFLIHISKGNDIEHYLEQFNRLFSSILVGGIYIKAVTPRDISKGEVSDHGYFRHTDTSSGNGVLHASLGNMEAGIGDRMELLNPRIVLSEDLQRAYLLGVKLFDEVSNLSPSLFISAFSYFNDFQLKESLSNTWTCIEQVLECLWKEKLLSPGKTENIQGRKAFLESQQWTAAHKIEMFYQLNIIDKETYTKLSNARDARNKFVHRGTLPKQENVNNALFALISLIVAVSEIKGFDFNSEFLKQLISPTNYREELRQVAKVQDVDWSKVSHFRLVRPIPGDGCFNGDFERINIVK